MKHYLDPCLTPELTEQEKRTMVTSTIRGKLFRAKDTIDWFAGSDLYIKDYVYLARRIEDE